MGADDRGWGAPIPYGDSRIVGLTVAGVTFGGGVHRRVRPILAAVAREWHERVEPLGDGCWGHAYRRIRGSSAWSNHAWGLAIDINAPAHPLGRDTMGAAASRQARRIASRYGCRWGGDYSGRLDQMHLEYMGTPAEADRMAAGLGGETEGETMISKGDQGQVVKQWQQSLRRYFWYQDVDALPRHGADGDYGDETVEWTNRWAGEVGLAPGMVTPMHWTVLGLSLYRRDDPATVVDKGDPRRLDDRSLMDFAHVTRKAVGELDQKVTRLLNQSGVDVDEAALAQDILAGLREHLTVDQLAALVRDGLGAELAANLAARLQE